MQKLCRGCNTEKDIGCFAKGSSLHGTYHRCRDCAKAWDRIRKTPEVMRKNNLRNHHALSVEDYNWLARSQDGKCALCFKPPTDMNGILVIDHWHGHIHKKVGQKSCKECIRGLLCDACNLALGFLEKCSHLQNDLARAYLQRRPFSRI